MKWDLWLAIYLGKHCVARGLMPRTIAAYEASLRAFRAFVRFRLDSREPDGLSARDVLEYIEYLRKERNNGAHAVNRQVTILKCFYRAIVAMGHLDPSGNPLVHFPKIKAAPRKLPDFLSDDEVRDLLAQPRTDTVLGLRDRALLTLLYGTGIRASECATLTEGNVDLRDDTVRVIGKGGHERVVPLNPQVARALAQYRAARGRVAPAAAFFRTRGGRGMSRYAVYERVRSASARARIHRRVSPHKMRHTFATHLVKRGVGLVTIRDLLGHRCISSTQVYLHTTAEDLRRAAELHPVERLVTQIEDLLPNVKLPLQWPPGERRVRAS